jgi:replicative DNA helicase
MADEMTNIAERLLAGLYHNPEHIGRVEAEEPTMPDAATQRLWDVMSEVAGPDSFDTARVSSLLNGLEGDGAQARDLLQRIRSHDVLGPVEATRYGHRGEELEDWGRQLAHQATKDRLATRLGKMAAKINASGTDLSLEEIQSGILSEVQSAVGEATSGGLQHVSEFIDEAIEDTRHWEEGETTDFLRTGFYSLDRKITGVPVGELTIFAAPSGAGKTSWLLQLLRQVAVRDRDEAVCLFSIEMPAKKVIHRAAAGWKGLPLDKVRENATAQAGQGKTYGEKHRGALNALEDLPLYIDEDPEPTLGQIYSRVMQVQARHDVALVGVDYDEKVDPEEAPPSEEQRVAAISKGLKTLAKQTESACVALSQYNSAPSSQVRPGTNDDLRYSRKKKHEAHTILHWYWPAYWLRSGDVDLEAGDEMPEHYNPQREELGRLYVGKDRDGGPGWVPLEFHAEQTAFVDPNDPQNDATEANPEPVF